MSPENTSALVNRAIVERDPTARLVAALAEHLASALQIDDAAALKAALRERDPVYIGGETLRLAIIPDPPDSVFPITNLEDLVGKLYTAVGFNKRVLRIGLLAEEEEIQALAKKLATISHSDPTTPGRLGGA